MSAVTATTPTIHWKPALVVAFVLTVVAMIASPHGPLGGFWRPNAGLPAPTGGELPFFILLNLAEAITFGLGVSFLLFGYPLVQSVPPASAGLTRLSYFAIAWLLISWWPHDSLHLHNGFELGGLLAIEYVFHISLMIAGVILAYFLLTLVRRAV